ncbi:phosphatases II [Ganoderma leucocontextum]|nr:phosphatases II [Ganoderma leucocontextum]
MVTTVLEARPIPATYNPRRISRIASEPLPNQTKTSNSRPAYHSTTPREDALISQLGPLASQHHASEYHRVKFGPKGSPLGYVPYSVQMPDHYMEMVAHQTRCAEQPAWWPHKRPRKPSVRPSFACMPCCGDGDVVPANASECSAATDLREQLSAAISTSIIFPEIEDDRPVTRLRPQPHWQTSETHPIVISAIIPPDLVSTISSHLRRPAETSPVVFSVPSSHLLDRIISVSVSVAELDPPKTPEVARPPMVAPFIAPLFISQSSPALSIAKSLKLSSLFWVHPAVRRALKSGEEPPQPPYKNRPRPVSLIFPSRGSMEETILQRPKVIRNCSSPTLVEGRSKTETQRSDTALPLTTAVPLLRHISAIGVSVPAVPLESVDGDSRSLGNLYMSSCPGKKVRLDGPVRGRSTVCRDLRSDLSCIKRAGAACIICCLDDTEMQTLGVTWSEYVHTANGLGIDVQRIPIPEGLGPMDPAVLDSHLTKLIESYTLHGDAILVHCRGGVGRAGIIACCWMLKLGLCGWTEPLPGEYDASAGPTVFGDIVPGHALEGEQVSGETMRLVERLISVVRRRRSLKAIETYEQVKFLVEYVEFLRDQAASRTSFSGDLFAAWDAQVD